MDNNKDIIKLILNNQNDLHSRVKAIDDIDLSGEKKELTAELKKLLSREKTTSQQTMDWDPAAEERVVDIHIIGKLNQLNDDSENSRISEIVANAVPYIREFGDERKEDAKIIKSINQKKVYAMIVELSNSKKTNEVENAVVVLNNLHFPDQPVGGDLKNILPDTLFKFKYSHLRDEMDTYISQSEGKIHLSEDVNKFINDNNLQLANDNEFIVSESTLSDAIERNIVVTFNYYIENNKVMICTFQEAAKRWQNWWRSHEGKIK